MVNFVVVHFAYPSRKLANSRIAAACVRDGTTLTGTILTF